jgi:gliding motility-associated-like protein
MKQILFILIVGFCLSVPPTAYSQTQTCPLNINFSLDNLTHWEAYTGNNMNGNNDQTRQYYDSTFTAPNGTINVKDISEYLLSSVYGIQVLNNQGTDPFGSFPTIPTINGYAYNYSVLLGSTSISVGNSGGGDAGGYVRGISYVINVPATPVGQPYTMTYAYAMVLENGRHPSSYQPLFSATVTSLTHDSVITCASPQYFLPTIPGSTNQQDAGGTLDSAVAISEGFTVSPRLSPNPNPNAPANEPDPAHLQDVWYKGWNEVTFDLSPYRGQKVLLTFEADNCRPGGHFAYAYVALRNTCSGLQISGPLAACANGNFTYSIPALAGAEYAWGVPAGWSIESGANTNIINVNAGTGNGKITASELNGCANLKDTIQVSALPPTVPGNVTGNAVDCADSNTNVLTLSANLGNVINWIASTNGGTSWSPLGDTTTTYNSKNITQTTVFKALVQNGGSCPIDSSSPATITVDQLSRGGLIDPPNADFCANQTVADILKINNFVGQVVDWQSSTDSINWQNFAPGYTDTTYGVIGINQTTYYRSILKNGVCPADTSAVGSVKLFSTPFPQSTYDPGDTTICYGTPALLNAAISIGTSYTWINTDSLQNPGNGTIPSTVFMLSASAYPTKTTNYVLSIENLGCPNFLLDTFHINVIPQIIVNAGNDTAVVIGEPLQFNATSNDTATDVFLWTPSTDLNNANISNPVGIYGSNIDTITYLVTATDPFGCYGAAKISVSVFKTLPDIFVPNAFTPGKNINSVFRPVLVGISSLKYFRVYNRWGELVYSTSRNEEGWDGTINGKPQDTGTFVWMVQGTDYTGKIITKKGTVVLIR